MSGNVENLKNSKRESLQKMRHLWIVRLCDSGIACEETEERAKGKCKAQRRQKELEEVVVGQIKGSNLDECFIMSLKRGAPGPLTKVWPPSMPRVAAATDT